MLGKLIAVVVGVAALLAAPGGSWAQTTSTSTSSSTSTSLPLCINVCNGPTGTTTLTTSTTTTSTSTSTVTTSSTSSSTTTSTSSSTSTSTTLSGSTTWTRKFGTSDSDAVYGVATDASGNVYVSGNYGGALAMGAATLTSAGGLDIFVAKYNSTNTMQWAASFGGISADTVKEGTLAFDSNNTDLVLTGSFSGTATFGACGAKTSPGSLSTFVLQLNASTGACRWVKTYSDAPQSRGRGVAYGPSGEIYVVGYFTGVTDFGAGNLTPTPGGGASSMYVLKLAHADGATTWSKTYTGTGNNFANAVGADSNGVVIGGQFSNAITFTPTTYGAAPAGYNDAFVLALDTSGAIRWSKQIQGTTNNETMNAVATDGSGGIFVAGQANGAADLGCGTDTAIGSSDGIMTKYNSAGTVQWCKRVGSTASDTIYSLAYAMGTLYVGGQYSRAATFDGSGGSPLASLGGVDGFLAKYNSTSGAVIAVQAYGGGGDDTVSAVCGGPTIVGGSFSGGAGNFPYPSGPILTPVGSSDGFLARNP